MNTIIAKLKRRLRSILAFQWFAVGLALILIPFLILTSATLIRATPALRGAIVTGVAQRGVQYRFLNSANPRRWTERRAVVNDPLREPNQQLIISPSQEQGAYRATVQGLPRIGQRTLTFHAQSNRSQIRYWYPCRSDGSVLLAWSSGGANELGCAPPGVVVSASSGSTSRGRSLKVNAVDRQSTSPAKQNSLLAQSSLGGLLDHVTSRVRVQYCSYIEDSGTAWSTRSSFVGTSDPCRQAEEECQSQVAVGKLCGVASTGEWQLSRRDLVFSLDCAGDRSYRVTESGRVILASLFLQVRELARSIRGNACVVNVFPPGSMLVSPATNGVTIVQIREVGDRLAVDALVGDVAIRSAETPRGQPFTRLPQGFTYISGSYDGDQYYPSPSPIEQNSQAANTPLVQDFLKASVSQQATASIPANLAGEMTAQLAAYQRALNQTLARGNGSGDTTTSPGIRNLNF